MKKNSLARRIIAFSMVTAMAAGLSGCSNDSANNTTTAAGTTQGTSEGATAGSTQAAGGDIDTSKHEKIKMLVLGNKPTNGRLEAMMVKLNEALTEKVNAELELSYIEWADWQTQYNMQLLSGDTSLDIITTATDWLYAWENTQKGAFMPLSEDMLKTYAPKTYEQVAALDDWKYCKYNGEIYFIPEDNYTQYTNHGLFYRGDWATEAGLSNGEVTKFEDLTTYFKYIKDNKPDVIPWDAAGKNNGGGVLGGYLNSKTPTVVIPAINVGNYEFWTGASKDDPFTVTSPYMEGDELYAAAELMKEWDTLGVWREDVLNYDGDPREEMYAGTNGADQHHSQTFYSQIRPNMDKKQPGSEAKMYYWGQENKNLSKPLKTHGAAAISANSAHPERTLMVYDLLRTDEECYRLINYGIEGTDYIVTEDGKLGRPEGWDKSLHSLDANFWCGRNDDLELADVELWSGTDDMIANYDSFAYDNPYTGLIIDKNAFEAESAAMANVLAEYIPLLAYGKYDDPKAKVDEMREKLKAAGYDSVKEKIQQGLNDYKTSLGE